MTSQTIEAYDDGFFPVHYKGGKGKTYIVGVEVGERAKVKRIAWSTVWVDLNTSMQAIASISRTFNGTIMLLDGVTYAGFDVVDPLELSLATGKAVVVVQTHPLDLTKIRLALQKHFADWSDRYHVIERVYKRMMLVETPWRTIRVFIEGISTDDAISMVRSTCVYSPVPEPLRIADKVASALSRMFIRYN